MTDRNGRIQIYKDTMQMIVNTPVLVEALSNSVCNQKIYWKKDEITPNTNLYPQEASITTTAKRCIDAASAYPGQKVCVLNFASSVSPGGGVVKGAGAQEESICRITTLYPALASDSVSTFYREHKEGIKAGSFTRRNNDDCIYTPGVIVLKEDDFDCASLPEEKRFPVDIITCAAPDQRDPYGEYGYNPSPEEELNCFRVRIRRILQVAALNQPQVLILGAFGCGAFYNNPVLVAEAFRLELPAFMHAFRTIEFAVPCQGEVNVNYLAFMHCFGQ